jgi:uncharacterized protein RhaS with RHS repeats
LTQYRAYDPVAGRWLSRDPISEGSDLAANLYRYVDGNPANSNDPTGLGPMGTAVGGLGGGIISIAGSIAVDAGTGGLNILATPEELGAGILAGAAAGNALEDSLRAALSGASSIFCPSGPTLHQASSSRPFQGVPGSTIYGGDGSRTYGPDGFPETDVDIGHDHGAGDPHAHDWGRPSSGGPPTARDRGPGRPIGPGDPSPTTP